MKFWTAIDIWPDSTVYIIGGGPSLKNMDLSQIQNKRIIGVNNAYQLGEWVDVCWWGDCPWWRQHAERLKKFPGLKIHCCNRHAIRPDTKRLLRGRPLGIDLRPEYVAWNNSSGASAVNLAVHFGAKRIVLLGFDMKKGPNGENNWHTEHKNYEPDWNPYDRFLKVWPHIRKDAKKIGVEILNATPDSALTLFPMVKLEDIV